MVEFPSDYSSATVPLDQVPAPPDCRVQVKTVWEGKSIVQMRLSSAECLGKLDQPAAVFVLCIGTDLEIAKLFALHVEGEFLSYILREIRKCEAKNSLLINKKKVSFDFNRFGREILVGGSSIREYITEINGPDRHEYISKKRFQIQNLGVTGSRLAGQIILQVKSADELTDILLGRRSAKFIGLERTDTRWDIPIVLPDIGQTGSVTFDPRPKLAELSLKAQNPCAHVGTSLSVAVTTAAASDGSDHLTKIFLQCDLVTFLITVDGSKARLNVDFGPDRLLTVSSQTKRNLLRVLLSRKGRFRLKDRFRTLFANTYSSLAPDGTTELCEDLHDVLLKLSRVIAAAGGSDSKVVCTISQIDGQLATLDFISELLASQDGLDLIEFSFDTNDTVPAPGSVMEILLCGFLRLERETVAFSALGDASFDVDNAGDRAALSRTAISILKLRLRRLEIFDNDEEELERFSADSQADTGATLVATVGDVA